jgi:hypothetical protein
VRYHPRGLANLLSNKLRKAILGIASGLTRVKNG